MKKGVPLKLSSKKGSTIAKLTKEYEENKAAKQIEKETQKVAKRGGNPSKKLAQMTKKLAQKQAAKAAKAASKSSVTPAQQKVVLKKLSKTLVKERKRHMNKMLKALPAGKGLRRAFKKIEAAKIKAPKGKSSKMKAMVKKDLGMQPKMTGLTEAAKDLAIKLQKDKVKLEGKAAKRKKVSPKQVIKMVKQVQKQKLPGQTTKGVYGMSKSKLVKKLEMYKPPSKKKLKKIALKTKKALQHLKVEAKSAKSRSHPRGTAGGEELYDLSV